MKWTTGDNHIKLFFFLIDEEAKESYIGCPAKLFQPCLIFVSKARANLSGAHNLGKLRLYSEILV
jgi:hypothetical protein